MVKQPLVVAYGLGVDSTAMLIGMQAIGMRPDLILFADTGNEKQETYDYLPIIQEWLASVSFPLVRMVRKVVMDFKHWPPYYSLGENCLTNGTLPSLAFGFKSCSLKWKVYPQDQFCNRWQPAIDCWASGQVVKKFIGFDAGPKDMKRYTKANQATDKKYSYHYPLVEWNWHRERCKAEIAKAGLPVPPKSACVFCPSTQPEELHEMKKVYLRYIVIMEARAEPRLKEIKGLWRNGVKGTRGGKKKPGKITDYIREYKLLPEAEIDHLVKVAPKMIVDQQEQHLLGIPTPDWADFIDSFATDAADEIPLPRRIPLSLTQPQAEDEEEPTLFGGALCG